MNATSSTSSTSEDYCSLTTTGRRSGRPHRIEIWDTADDTTLYLLAGGGRSSGWAQNLEVNPGVQVELEGRLHQARCRMLDGVQDGDEAERARSLVVEKYTPRDTGDLASWRGRALARRRRSRATD